MKELIKEQLFQFALLIATDDWNRVLDFCITNNTDVRSATEQLTRYIECRYLRENKIKKLSEIPDSL
ncbi:MAG: hypothetical protein NTU97_04765, partial [Candidatus Magasanikbacteria bacterium]|nr:hypothetical protein [Candidatus Magasanikbacteria bacterium]